jgi:hypothetical protein
MADEILGSYIAKINACKLRNQLADDILLVDWSEVT